MNITCISEIKRPCDLAAVDDLVENEHMLSEWLDTNQLEDHPVLARACALSGVVFPFYRQQVSCDLASECLVLAARCGHDVLVRLLCQTPHVDLEKGRPLAWACAGGHEGCVNILLEQGADPGTEKDEPLRWSKSPRMRNLLLTARVVRRGKPRGHCGPVFERLGQLRKDRFAHQKSYATVAEANFSQTYSVEYGNQDLGEDGVRERGMFVGSRGHPRGVPPSGP